MYISILKIYQNIEQYLAEHTVFTIKGWVRSHRTGENGKLHFITISDGSTIKNIQTVYQGEHNKIDYMSSIEITGYLVESPAVGQNWEMKANEIQIIGDCQPDKYPLPRKKLPLTVLRQYPHLRMRTKTMEAVFRIRHKMWKAIMDFFDERDFISIHTPIINKSDCEGAGETFKVDGGPNFFPTQAYLTVSGQMEAEMSATALGKIFTYGPTFRAEHSDTPRHLAEFWMVEPEMAWYNLDDTIELAVDLIKYCVQSVEKICNEELKLLGVRFDERYLEFKRISYTEAVDILNQSRNELRVSWGEDLGTIQEKYLTDEYYKSPVIITHYPKKIKSFYMKQNADETVECFDLLLPGIGEVIGGSQREINYDILINEMKMRNMDIDRYSRYLELRKYGNVPHAGFGLGFERLIRYATKMENIRDVIPFPVSYGHL